MLSANTRIEGMVMEDIYNQYVELCENMCTADDYVDKAKLRKHNQAMRKILDLHKKMKEFDSSELLAKLLSNSNEQVILHAASFGIQNDVLYCRSMKALENLDARSKDPSISINAHMSIKYCDCKKRTK